MERSPRKISYKYYYTIVVEKQIAENLNKHFTNITSHLKYLTNKEVLKNI